MLALAEEEQKSMYLVAISELRLTFPNSSPLLQFFKSIMQYWNKRNSALGPTFLTAENVKLTIH